MSVIGNNHQVSKLEKTSKAFEGQRMARVIAKKGKSGGYESSNLIESKFVSVPKISEVSATQLETLKPHLFGILHDAQDAIIRELIVNDGISSVNDEQISVDACIKYLDDVSKGSRLTREYMQQWFIENYYEAAMEFVCLNAKFDPNQLTVDQSTVVETKANVLRDMFAGFAGARYRPEIPQCKAMMKFGEFLGELLGEDARMSGYIEKAKKVKEERDAELSMDALGF